TFSHTGFGFCFGLFSLGVVIRLCLLPAYFNLLFLELNVIFTFHLTQLQIILFLLLTYFQTLPFDFQPAFFLFVFPGSPFCCIFLLGFSEDAVILQVLLLTAVGYIHFPFILLI